MAAPDPLIPSGRYCYRLEPIAPGEVMSKDIDRFGKDLREFSFGGGRKEVLCPYWRRTDHGTVRCEKMNLEVFDEESDPQGAVAKATMHFGADTVKTCVTYSDFLPDEIKVCDIAMDEDWGKDDPVD